MKISPLEKVLNSLIEIKACRHDETNTDVIEKLDEAICFVQECIENGTYDSKSIDTVYIVLGKFLEKLPSIAALIKYLSD